MKPTPLLPALHFFVCAHRREPGSPLGCGCGSDGDDVFAALKDEVAKRGAFRTVWVTQTKCLGICPKRGATVAIYPRQAVMSEVESTDVPQLFAEALAASEVAATKRGL